MDNRINPKEISMRLKQIRLQLNLTPNQVFQSTGVSTGNLSELENGKYPPSAKTLVLLSELYGVSIDWILKGIPSNVKEDPGLRNSFLLQNKELTGFFQKLSESWANGDRDMQGWILVQLRLAFPQVAAEIKKELKNSSDNGQ